ncbi:heme anaerobic degradation radical SAM methyltransferase ChuW/HutW [Pleomorphomonas carboxyditropha]|uniref:Putative heme utilization radical SAM enzyme HutW n=1 Tax=Pleomorphomonas carboxyditropha TaxID=2023338 RepID=A0A2G9WZS2_9HYPH|nr:heme anaerobic degradation radical SAM methyltransferase ChuW/HutW [Pleomorphomonas carboxyditropha]PIP00165.1 putative heme utilization radical SAM enzyme HutW [Pleomorphomonas carboxyditropha]
MRPQQPSARPAGHPTAAGGMSPSAGPADLSAFLPVAGGDALTGAFARRAPMMPWQTDRRIAEEEFPRHVAAVFGAASPARRVAYVHVPFCHTHCLFCGFYQNPYDAEETHAFAGRLVREIEAAAARPLHRDGRPIEAVFLGGGTPTALAAEDIAAVVGALRRCLPLAEDCEITLEGRTHDFTPDKVEAALGAGVTRFSIGVQSFDTRVRRRLGRKFDRAGLLALLEELVQAGGASLVIDLIYGLPGQDATVWRDDVETAAGLGLDGLDIYALSIFPGVPLSRAITAGKTLPVPSLATQAESYAHAVGRFAELGWKKLSQAHMARTGRERSLYNQLVKTDAACLAFGPGAGGSAHGRSWRTVADLAEWSRRIEVGAPTVAMMAEGTPRRAVHARIRSQLEDGVFDGASVEALVPGFLAAAEPLLSAWTAAGLGARQGSSFRTTVAGDFWMTTLAAGLIQASETLGSTRERAGIHAGRAP